MNALYSMASSCVVYTAFDRVKVGSVNLEAAPAIQLGEDSDQIYEQIVKLKDWKQEDFVVRGQKSRCFVDRYNSPLLVASEVLKSGGANFCESTGKAINN